MSHENKIDVGFETQGSPGGTAERGVATAAGSSTITPQPSQQTETPVPESSILLADNFDSVGGYRSDVWYCTGCDHGDVTTYEGSARFELSSQGRVDLFSVPSFLGDKISYVQARMRVAETKGSEIFPDVHLVLYTEVSEGSWLAVCWITKVRPEFQCTVETISKVNGENNEYHTAAIPVNYWEWHTAKIEVIPGSFKLNFYFDSKLIGAHTPTAANELKEKYFRPYIGVSSKLASSHILAYVDDMLLVSSSAAPIAAVIPTNNQNAQWQAIATSRPSASRRFDLKNFEVRMKIDPGQLGTFDLVGQIGENIDVWPGRVFIRLGFDQADKFNVAFFDSREGGKSWETEHVISVNMPSDRRIRVRIIKNNDGSQSISVLDSNDAVIGGYTLPRDGFPDGVRFISTMSLSEFAVLVPSEDMSTPQPTNKTTQVVETITSEPPLEITDSKNIPMRLIPAGEFIMGSDSGEDDERPSHRIYLDAYYMDKYEVTNAAYRACVEAGKCLPPTNSQKYNSPRYDQHPVVFVTWSLAKSFCEWRSARLPTEAEWEKAARGTDGRTYPWGEGINHKYTNYNLSYGTTAVGSYPDGVSPYVVYDMSGNAWEWVADWYAKNYYRSYAADGWIPNPPGPRDGSFRALRGGAWDSGESFVRSASRSWFDPLYDNEKIGFRCAKSASP